MFVTLNYALCWHFFESLLVCLLNRVQIVKDGKKRKLIINGCKLEDAGNITVKSNADESSADLDVKCKYNIW